MRGVNRTAAAQVRPPGLGTTATRTGEAGDPERHRHHRRARAGGPCRGARVTAHLHRRAPAAARCSSRACSKAARATGTTRCRARDAPWTTASTTSASARSRGRHRGTGGISRLPRLAPGLPDRLEQRPQAAARSARQEGRHGSAKWAADNDLGHMAFLQAGGEQMIYDALDFVSKGQAPSASGWTRSSASARRSDFLRFVIRPAREASRRAAGVAIRDEVRAELFNYFRTARRACSTSRPTTRRSPSRSPAASATRCCKPGAAGPTADRAQRRARQGVGAPRRRAGEPRRGPRRGIPSPRTSSRSVEAADDIADELEDAAFHLTLLPPRTARGRRLPACKHWRAAGAGHAGIREGRRERAARAARRCAKTSGFPRRDPSHHEIEHAPTRRSARSSEADGQRRRLAALYMFTGARETSRGGRRAHACGMTLRDQCSASWLAARCPTPEKPAPVLGAFLTAARAAPARRRRRWDSRPTTCGAWPAWACRSRRPSCSAPLCRDYFPPGAARRTARPARCGSASWSRQRTGLRQHAPAAAAFRCAPARRCRCRA